MITALFFPNLPILAFQMVLGTTKSIIVHSGGYVTAPAQMSGIRIDQAMALRPLACPLSRQPALERAAWEHIIESVYKLTPSIVDVEPGRLLCSTNNILDITRLVARMGGCAGTARTATLAMLAAVSAHPGTIVRLDDDSSADFLDTLPLRVLHSFPELEISQRTTDRLELFGMGTIGRIRRLTRQQWQDQFQEQGLRLHEFLRSLSDSNPIPLYVPAPTATGIVSFSDPVTQPDLLQHSMNLALDNAIQHLQKQHTRRLEVSLLDASGNPLFTASRILRASTSQREHLLVQATAILNQLTTSHPLQVAQPSVQGLRIRLGALSVVPPSQTSLFRTKPNAEVISKSLARRFPAAIKHVRILDAYTCMPDRFALVEPWNRSGGGVA